MVCHGYGGKHALRDLIAQPDMIEMIMQKMERDGLTQAVVDAISEGRTEYSVGDLSIPGLRHFLYKSRPQVQITMPVFEDPYDDPNERRRCAILVGCQCHHRAERQVQANHIVSNPS